MSWKANIPKLPLLDWVHQSNSNIKNNVAISASNAAKNKFDTVEVSGINELERLQEVFGNTLQKLKTGTKEDKELYIKLFIVFHESVLKYYQTDKPRGWKFNELFNSLSLKQEEIPSDFSNFMDKYVELDSNTASSIQNKLKKTVDNYSFFIWLESEEGNPELFKEINSLLLKEGEIRLRENISEERANQLAAKLLITNKFHKDSKGGSNPQPNSLRGYLYNYLISASKTGVFDENGEMPSFKVKDL